MSSAIAERPSENTENASDEKTSMEQLAIVERYERFIDYVYPILLGIRRSHYIVRDRAIGAVVDQVALFNDAGKSGQISRLYAADAGLASLRFYLRFLAAPSRKLISNHQHQVASVLLAEVGKMLGGWIRRTRPAKR